MEVVGGEEGSNGTPVPTLEMLPPTGPVITMEWLERTDPYNLYPFLAVLPSGGIFAGYYNKARVLDPVTFATTKGFPWRASTICLTLRPDRFSRICQAQSILQMAGKTKQALFIIGQILT